MTLKFKIVFLLFVSVSSLVAHATPQVLAESNAMRVVTSDKAFREEMNFCFKQKSTLAIDSLSEKPSKEMQIGTNVFLNQGYSTKDLYTGARASLFVNRDFSNFKLEGSMGLHNLKNETSKKSQDIVMGSAKATINPDGQFEFGLGGNHDYVYTDLFQPGGAEKYITSSGITPRFAIRPADRTKIQAWHSWKYLSDNNWQMQGEFSALYEVSQAPTSIWLGVGADHIRFQHWTSNYWSPDHVYGYSAKIETDTAFAKRWTAVVNCSIGRGYDNGPNTWGIGYYLSSLVRYKPRENMQFEFYMNRLETGIEKDRWYLSQFGVNASTPF